MTARETSYLASGLALGVSVTTIGFQVALCGVPPFLVSPLFVGYALVLWRMSAGHLSRPTSCVIVAGWTVFMLALMWRVGHFGGVS
jgi:hypothetical protein